MSLIGQNLGEKKKEETPVKTSEDLPFPFFKKTGL